MSTGLSSKSRTTSDDDLVSHDEKGKLKVSNDKALELQSQHGNAAVSRSLSAPTEISLLIDDIVDQHQLPREYLANFNLVQLRELQAALAKWNVGGDGVNQGFSHVVSYALGGATGKDNRLTKLEEYLGLGPFDVSQLDVIPRVTDALDSLPMPSASGIKSVGNKEFLFHAKAGAVEPFGNSQKGIIIIRTNGKLSSFMNSDYKKFKEKV